jgi:hypothetical protein
MMALLPLALALLSLLLALGVVYMVLKVEILRWILALVGFVVVVGWLARSCGHHAKTVGNAVDDIPSSLPALPTIGN